MSVFEHIKKIHLLGIEGSGMKGLGLYLASLGYEISGSDIKASTHMDGPLTIYQGHNQEYVMDKDLVIHSNAVDSENEEILEAKRLRIPVLTRASAMAQLIREKSAIAVSGIHGKTTTTGMIGKILIEAGFDPTVFVGGSLPGQIHYCRSGNGLWTIFEADESDGSLLAYYPHYSVITNVELEHVDYFKDIEQLLKMFYTFIEQTASKVVLCIDDPQCKLLFKEFTKEKFFTYGFSPQAQMRGSIIKKTGEGLFFSVSYCGRDLGSFSLPLYGQHHIQNAMAAICIGLLLDVDMHNIKRALASFQGMERRFQIMGAFKGASIVNDYAHHPQEVRACLNASRQRFKGKILGVFQPHRFSRFQKFIHDFAEVLKDFDAVIIAEIYPGFETNCDEISAQLLFDLLIQKGFSDVSYCSSLEGITQHLKEINVDFDAILFMGAGDIDWVTRELLLDDGNNKVGNEEKGRLSTRIVS